MLIVIFQKTKLNNRYVAVELHLNKILYIDKFKFFNEMF